MYGIHKILVGVDFVTSEGEESPQLSPPAARAVELALRIGRRWSLPVTFLFVQTDAEGTTEGTDPALLDRLVAQARESGVQVSSRTTSGRPWMEIIREVLREQYDLVLVGSRNHRMRDLLLGTTGTKLLRKCPATVWVARPETSSHIPLVMVAHDLSEVGRKALELGVNAAQLLDARLLIVHAVHDPVEPVLRRTGAAPEEIGVHRQEQIDAARRAIQEHLDRTDHRTLTHGVQVEVAAGVPDAVLQEAIVDHEADLLVMGTVARTGIPGLLVGNTAERLFSMVECSILAVKPEDFETPVRLEE